MYRSIVTRLMEVNIVNQCTMFEPVPPEKFDPAFNSLAPFTACFRVSVMTTENKAVGGFKQFHPPNGNSVDGRYNPWGGLAVNRRGLLSRHMSVRT
jgi:hypothetical protein